MSNGTVGYAFPLDAMAKTNKILCKFTWSMRAQNNCETVQIVQPTTWTRYIILHIQYTPIQYAIHSELFCMRSVCQWSLLSIWKYWLNAHTYTHIQGHMTLMVLTMAVDVQWTMRATFKMRYKTKSEFHVDLTIIIIIINSLIDDRTFTQYIVYNLQYSRSVCIQVALCETNDCYIHT